MHEEGFCKTQKLIHEKEFYKQLGINLPKTWSKFIKKIPKNLERRGILPGGRTRSQALARKAVGMANPLQSYWQIK